MAERDGHRRGPFTIGVLVALAVLVGCSSSEAGDEGAAEEGEETSIGRELLLGGSDESVHQLLEDHRVDCMKNQGFAYSPVPFQAVTVVNVGPGADLPDREEFGFGISIPRSEDRPATADANAQRLESMSVQERDAFVAAIDGCSTEADAALAKRRDDYLAGLDEEDSAYFQQVVSGQHPLIVDAMQRWSQCMAAKGWEFSSTQALMESLEAEYATMTQNGKPMDDALRTFQSKERKAAVDDLRCNEMTVNEAAEALIADVDSRFQRYGVTSLYD